MSRICHIYILLICIFCFTTLKAQLPANPIGLNPDRIKWSQIKTDKVQVIYPRGLDAQGQRVANIVHYLWDKNNESIGDKKQRVTILLQNQPSLSNGFVTPGPFRSEFFLTPPQFNYTSDWLDILAIHEYRHVKQFGNARKGVTALVRWLSGSWGWGGMAGLAWPRWYWEGDATTAETRLSKSGRGRLPSFDMEYRSLLVDGKKFGYEKAGALSLKEFVPDWYTLGYHLVSYGRNKHGEGFWAKVAEDGVRYKGIFYPFSQSIKRQTGNTAETFYQEMVQYRDSVYQAQLDNLEITKAENISPAPPSNAVVNYSYPQFLSDGSLVYQEQGYDRNPAYFIQSPNGELKKLCNSGRIVQAPEGTLSAKGQKLCWAEIQFDLRWSNRNFFVIRTYDLKTGKKQRLTGNGQRYFSPALSHDAQKIVITEVTEELENRLVILNAETGAILQTISIPENAFPSYPIWDSNGSNIFVILQKGENSRLVSISLSDQSVQELSPALPYQISHPYLYENNVYFAAAYTGINNIFSVNLGNKKIQQITSVKTGAFNPAISVDGTHLVYSEFSSTGYSLKKMPLINAINREFQLDQLQQKWIYLSEQGVTHESILKDIPLDTFPVKKFRKSTGLLFPHSWIPTVSDPIYGIQLLSDNKFSTLSASASAFYNRNDEDWTLSGEATFAGWYPQLHAGFQKVERSHLNVNFQPLTDTTLTRTISVNRWDENRIIGGVSLPFNFSRGAFFNRLFIRGDYQRLNLEYEAVPRDDTTQFFQETLLTSPATIQRYNQDGIFQSFPSSKTIHGVDLRMTLYSLQQQAIQHMAPRLGFLLQMRYQQTMSDDELNGKVFWGRFRGYLPGFHRNHSLRFGIAYQQEALINTYQYSDFFIFPRGYDAIGTDKRLKLSADYSFPIAYPDLALGPFAFIKRIKGNVFYDHGLHWNDFPFVSTKRNLNSVGIELNVDFRLFRLLEIDMGVRYSYLLNQDFAPSGQIHQFDFFTVSITE